MEDRVKKIISDVLGVDRAVLSDDFASHSVDQWDSIRHLSLVLALEEEFQVEFDEVQIGQITSYKLIVDALRQNREINEGLR